MNIINESIKDEVYTFKISDTKIIWIPEGGNKLEAENTLKK